MEEVRRVNIPIRLNYDREDLSDLCSLQESVEKGGSVLLNVGYLADEQLLEIAGYLGVPADNPAYGVVSKVSPNSTLNYDALSFREVKLHNESIYYPAPPDYVMFFCDESDCDGGDTILVRGAEVVHSMPTTLRQRLLATPITFRIRSTIVNKILLIPHPRNSETILFFKDFRDNDPNYELITENESDREFILTGIRQHLYAPCLTYLHSWQKHDLLILDNYSVLHGRRAFTGRRSLRRVLVHSAAHKHLSI